MRRATRRVTAIYDEALAPVGVNVAQWALLRNLARSPRRPVSIQELADSADLERSTASRNVRVLARLGLVRVGGSQDDRRVSAVELTDRAMSVLERGEPLWLRAQERVEELLGAREAGALRSLLHSL
jgi:DNA-binding MarR family transcriptional regulator